MEAVRVFKRTIENPTLGCKLILTIMDVCDVVKQTNGDAVLDFCQIYNVCEVWR